MVFIMGILMQMEAIIVYHSRDCDNSNCVVM